LAGTAVDRREDRLWDLHGRAHFEHGDNWQAIGSFREAHRLNPYDPVLTLRLAMALMQNKLFREAFDDLSDAVRWTPNFPELWEPLGATAYELNEFDAATTAFNWMLYFHIKEPDAYCNKAAALGNQGRYLDALHALLDAQARFPQNGKIQVNLSITYLKMGLRGEAVAAWRKAYALAPSDPQVYQLKSLLKQ
jgi:Flp pilus assembly protein TadD